MTELPGGGLRAGGWIGPATFTATTEIFDPATGRFSPWPTLPEAVLGLAATSLARGSVLLTEARQDRGRLAPVEEHGSGIRHLSLEHGSTLQDLGT